MKKILRLQSALLKEIDKYEKLVPKRSHFIDWERVHITSCAKIGYMLAEERGVDPILAAAACAVHDYGRIITGKTSDLLGASSAALLNALKEIGGINDNIPLISPNVIEPIQKLKVQHLGNHNPRLHTDEILIALAIAATNNPVSHLAMQQLKKLKDCEVHSTVLLSEVDSSTFKKLGMNLTCEPVYQKKKLYHR